MKGLLVVCVWTGLALAADPSWTVTRDAAGRITGVDLRGTWVTDTDLRKLAQLPRLSYLDLSLTRITDQGMQELKNAPAITLQSPSSQARTSSALPLMCRLATYSAPR